MICLYCEKTAVVKCGICHANLCEDHKECHLADEHAGTIFTEVG